MTVENPLVHTMSGEMKKDPTSHKLWLQLTGQGTRSVNSALTDIRKELTVIHLNAGCDRRIGRSGHDLT